MKRPRRGAAPPPPGSVTDPSPLKRGLKQLVEGLVEVEAAVVTDPSPLKRGLKPCANENGRRVFNEVTDPSPLKRGLKRENAIAVARGRSMVSQTPPR